MAWRRSPVRIRLGPPSFAPSELRVASQILNFDPSTLFRINPELVEWVEFYFGDVAQRPERSVRIRKVVGSNPTISTIIELFCSVVV